MIYKKLHLSWECPHIINYITRKELYFGAPGTIIKRYIDKALTLG